MLYNNMNIVNTVWYILKFGQRVKLWILPQLKKS